MQRSRLEPKCPDLGKGGGPGSMAISYLLRMGFKAWSRPGYGGRTKQPLFGRRWSPCRVRGPRPPPSGSNMNGKMAFPAFIFRTL